MTITIPNNRVGPPALRREWRPAPPLGMAPNAPGTIALAPISIEIQESSPVIVTTNYYNLPNIRVPNPEVGPPVLRQSWRDRPQLKFDAAPTIIDLSLQELGPLEEIISSVQPWMDNISGGIKSGYTTTIDVPISGGIRGGQTVPISGGIATPFIDPPMLPLAVHMGQGNVFFTWSHPTPEKVEAYEIYASLNLAGPYTKYPTGDFKENRGTIQNVPVGITIYFQLRAIGFNTAESTFVQVKKGKLYNPLVPMKVRAIRGSSIASGAIFNTVDQQTGKLIAIRAPAVIQIN